MADVRWGTGEERHLGRFRGERAVFVTANAKDGENIFAVRDGIYAKLAEFESALPVRSGSSAASISRATWRTA